MKSRFVAHNPVLKKMGKMGKMNTPYCEKRKDSIPVLNNYDILVPNILETLMCLAGDYVNEKGERIRRTPLTHRYSFEGYVCWHKGEFPVKYLDCVYTDRLLQEDYEKYNLLRMKHFGDHAQMNWEYDDPEKIEAFLSDWLERPVELVMVMKHCNVSSGFPLYTFHWNAKD